MVKYQYNSLIIYYNADLPVTRHRLVTNKSDIIADDINVKILQKLLLLSVPS